MHGWAPDVIAAVGARTPNPEGYLGVFFTASDLSIRIEPPTEVQLDLEVDDGDNPANSCSIAVTTISTG